MLLARADEGASVAVPAPALYVTFAATGDPPEVGVRVNVDAPIVPADIASLNVTTTLEPTTIPVVLFAGVTLVTVGAATSTAMVVKADENGVSPLFATSFAPLVTFIV